MADELRMALLELLSKAELEQDTDFLREGVRVLAEALMEVEVEQHLGAAKHERTGERTGYRNGTRVGTIQVKVPRVRDGSYFPRLLEPRKRAERALLAVVQEAYGQGVSTRRVDKVVQALGLEGISASQVARICKALDEEVERFRARRLTAEYPSVWFAATFVKVKENGRVVSQAVVAATIRTVFAQPDAASAREQWRRVADTLRPQFPRLADLLEEAEADVLAYLAFPREHWRQIWSNNPLERLNKEVKRRTDVVGIFPNTPAVIRLVGMVLAEQHDEWQEGRRSFSAESLAKLTEPVPATDPPPALLPAS